MIELLGAGNDLAGASFIVVIVVFCTLAYGLGSRCRAPGGCRRLFAEIRGNRFESAKAKIELFEQWREEATKTVIREGAHSSPWEVGEWKGRQREQLIEKIKYEVQKTTRFVAVRCRCRYCSKEWDVELPPEVDENWKRIGTG